MSRLRGMTAIPAPRGAFRDAGPGRDAVRRRVAEGLARDLLVLVRGGVYRQAETLTFDRKTRQTKNTRSPTRPIPAKRSSSAAGEGSPVGRKANGEIWTAELPEVKAGKWYFRQLFVNGRRAVRGRGRPTRDEKKPYCTIQRSSLVEGCVVSGVGRRSPATYSSRKSP